MCRLRTEKSYAEMDGDCMIQLRDIVAIELIIYAVVVSLDFMLTMTLFKYPYLEINPIGKEFMMQGIPPLNLFIPFIILSAFVIIGYNRYYLDRNFFNDKTVMFISKDELEMFKIYYFNNRVCFLTIQFFIIMFISGHIAGILTYSYLWT
jgi:hypothetical protein